MQTRFFNIIPGEGEVAILLYGDVGDGEKVESGRVVSELMALASQYKKIDVRINSNGGDVFSGIAIYNALRTSQADITIYVDGVAASIAGIIALCGKPLYMSPYAKLMLHSVSGGSYGTASALRRTAQMIENLQGDLAEMIAARCGMTAEAVVSRYFDEQDHWISASEAVNMKLADGIYELPDGPVRQPTTTEEIYQYFNNRLQLQPQKTREMALIDELKTIPSFKDKADEGAMLAHIKELENKATKADALEAANKAMKARLEEKEKGEVTALLDKAVTDGKITKEQRPQFEKLMAQDRATTTAVLEGMKPANRKRATDFINLGGEGAGDLASRSWDELDKAGKLAELKAHDPTLFANKFKEKFGVEYLD